MLIHKLVRRGLLVAFLGFSAAPLVYGQTAQQDNNVTLTIPQSRQVALNALRLQQPALALHIAGGLLQRDARDSFAHFTIAQASQQLARPNEGRRAAARAFRFSKTPQDKYASSQLAARLSYEAKRYTLAQYWLRRSVNFVETPQQREIISRDFKRLRSENPWNTQLRFSIAPSSNVNAGSNTNRFTIDGTQVWADLSNSAQALAGTVAVGDVSTSYRFSANAKHAAYLTGRIFTRQVKLTSASERRANIRPPTALPAPLVRSRDFSATTAEVGLKYVFRRGKGDGLSTVRTTIGKNWYAGDAYSTFSRLGYEHRVRPSNRLSLTFTGSYERRNYESSRNASASIARVGGRAGYRFEGGDAIQFGILANNTDSKTASSTSASTTAHISYEMGKPVGPASLAFGAGATYQDYPNYISGNVVAPGGRQDAIVFASIGATFNTVDYAGFVPKVTLRAQKNKSNISRFDTTQFSVSIGIQSSF